MLKSSISRLLVLSLLLIASVCAAETMSDAEQAFITEHMNRDESVVLKQEFDKYMKEHAAEGGDEKLALQAGLMAVRKAQAARGIVMPVVSAEVAAKLKDVDDNLAKLHAAEEAYQKDMLAAKDAFTAKNMELLGTLNLNQLSDKLPPDPRASDMQRRDRIHALNEYMSYYAATLNEWRTAQTLEVPAGAKKPKPFLDTISLRTVFNGRERENAFFTLYRELKIESQIPEVKAEATGVIDNAPWRKKQ